MAKFVLVLLAFAVIAAGTGVGIYMLQTRQDLSVSADPATTLSLRPSTTSPKVGDTFTVAVDIDTGENEVAVAELRVTYDPTKLNAIDFVPGTFLPNPATPGKNLDNPGMASINILINSQGGSTEGISGTGVVAELKFEATSPGSASIGFSPNTLIAAIDEETNVLISSQGTTITVTPDTSTPSPTPTTSPGTLTPTPSSQTHTVTITSPTNGSTIATTTPLITGQTSPSSSLSLNLSGPTPLSYSTSANTTGGWSWLPGTNLSGGTHTLTVTAVRNGASATATSTFTVTTGGGGNTNPTPIPTSIPGTSSTPIPTPTPATSLPQAGSITPTLTILTLSAGLMLFGIIALTKI